MNEVPRDKMIKAVKNFLKHQGYSEIEEIEEGEYIDIVAFDNKAEQYVFFHIHEGFSEDVDQEAFENFACYWFLSKGEDGPNDVGFRLDTIGLEVIRDDKAIIKHHVNAIND